MLMVRLFRNAVLSLSLLLPIAVVAGRADAQSISAASITNAALVSESGRPVRLSDFRGKVVFVNFWGSCCIPCIQEMASIRNFQPTLGAPSHVGFVFVSAPSQSSHKDGP